MFTRFRRSRGSKPPWAVALAAALAVGMLLSAAACSGGTAALQTLPPLHSPRPAAAATPTHAVGPRLSGKQAELAAAVAVVRRYYQVLNNLHDTMDAAALAALFTSHCFCQQQVRAVASAAARHEHYVDHATINKVVPNLDAPGRVEVLVDINASRGGLSRSNGQRVTTVAPQNHVGHVFRVRRAHGRWLIYEIDAA